jgi:threonine/homoserine/homoserine lactone efflux protein
MVEAVLSMVVLAIATTFTPGPSTLLAAASGARFGVRSTIPLMAGVALGLASLMVAAAAGLMVLLQAVPSIHIVVKVLGSDICFGSAGESVELRSQATNRAY